MKNVWEDYVQGFDSMRGLFQKERAGRRNTGGDKQFRAMIAGEETRTEAKETRVGKGCL